MGTKNIYSIKLDDINSNFTNFRMWKNGKDIDPDELTIDEMKLLEKELLEFSEMFKDEIKYLEEL